MTEQPPRITVLLIFEGLQAKPNRGPQLLRRLPADELVHRRQNGKFFLEVVASPRLGLPFGQGRLTPSEL